MKKQTTTISERDYVRLGRELERFGFKTYSDFLKSGLWAEFRKCIPRKSKLCGICGKNISTTVHHITYKKLLEPKFVRWVCSSCHKEIHENIIKLNGKLSSADSTFDIKRKNHSLTQLEKEKRRNEKKHLKYPPTKQTVVYSIVGYNGCGGKDITNPEIFKNIWLQRTRKEYLDIYYTDREYFDKIIYGIVKNKKGK